MSDLRDAFEDRLRAVEGITVERWKEGYPLIGVNFHGKEIGHFHGRDVLDIRLTPKFIKEKELSRAACEKHHPKRSKNSRWICVPFKTEADVDALMQLVTHACDVRS